MTEATSARSPSRTWRLFLVFSFIAGAILRLIYVQDMEYKEDEEYNFTQSQPSAPWAWIGMPSGVYIPNPGMSVWVFKALAWLAHATTPTELATAVQIFALLGIALVYPFSTRVLRTDERTEPWLWAMALALVNPFAVFYQRKLWPEPILPAFSMLWLAGWWRRDLWIGAFVWGLIGAWLGQIHMSGFFIAAALLICTLLPFRSAISRARVRWGAWFLGSTIGALPLIPWALSWLGRPVGGPVSRGWDEPIQAKFWVFWTTNPLGLHLGNTLGILRGHSNWDQLSDFVRYPLIGGQATYLCFVVHLVAAAASAAILLPTAYRFVSGYIARIFNRTDRRTLAPEAMSESHDDDRRLVVFAGIWGFGILLTASSVMIRRYYLMVSFPLEFVWLTSLALRSPRPALAKRSLAVLWFAQLAISTLFVGYIHVNEGSPTGDYGDAYHVVVRKRAQARP